MNMKLFRLTLVALAVAAVGLGEAEAKDPVVAVTAIVEHPALDAVRDGIRDQLAKKGFRVGENMRFEYQSAQGNPGTAVQIARQYVGMAPDVIVPISTPSAQAVVAATRSIPVVFTAVTDPVGAQLVRNTDRPGGSVTGLSDLSPLAQHLTLIKEITPKVARLGVLYNPGEPNSVTLLTLLKQVAPQQGMQIIEAPATKSADVQGAARSLVGKVDALYIPTDNTIVTALEAVLAVGDQNDIPVYSGDTNSVERGALATVGFDYYQVGRQTGDIVVRVLRGDKPADIPVRTAQGTDLFVNLKAAAAMGVTVSPEVIARAKKVIER
jgi:putative tryptophan/tyrosine transport system substrate-binding protein